MCYETANDRWPCSRALHRAFDVLRRGLASWLAAKNGKLISRGCAKALLLHDASDDQSITGPGARTWLTCPGLSCWPQHVILPAHLRFTDSFDQPPWTSKMYIVRVVPSHRASVTAQASLLYRTKPNFLCRIAALQSSSASLPFGAGRIEAPVLRVTRFQICQRRCFQQEGTHTTKTPAALC